MTTTQAQLERGMTILLEGASQNKDGLGSLQSKAYCDDVSASWKKTVNHATDVYKLYCLQNVDPYRACGPRIC